MSKIYCDLGLEPIINAGGTATIYSGNLMHPEVTDAMSEASRSFVVLEELHLAAGKRIAELIGVPSAHVCSSATAGIALMGAAAITRTNRDLVRRLPHVEELPHEMIVQKSHRMAYDQAIEISGCRFVEIEPTVDALAAAINEKTAGIFHVHSWSLTKKTIPLTEVAQVAKAHGVPVLVDAASELPPMENLRRFLDEGGDLVVFSGGKGLRGPQASGLIMGRPDMVEACRINDCPFASIGRSMKAGKEEIVGLVKAVEIYVNRDHAADMSIWERRVQYIIDQVSSIPGVNAWREVPYGIGNLSPQVALTWDVNRLEVSYQEFFDQMKAGSPRIVTRQFTDPTRNQEPQARILVHTLQEGQEVIVARRTREVLGA